MEKNIRRRKNNRIKKKRKFSFKKFSWFLIFQLFFGIITAPLILLYGPFENAKRTYVGAAMTTMSKQWLATTFLSNERIANILGQNSVDDSEIEKEDSSLVEIPKIKDNTIEHNIIENNKFTGHLLIIKDPTRVAVGYTSKLYREGETTSQIAINNNAVAAVNGGSFTDEADGQMWTANGGNPTGLIIANGEVIHNDIGNDNTETDIAAITKDGRLIVGKHSLNDLKKLGVKEALSFGPALVVNGKMTSMSGDGGWGVAPRTVIGQRSDGAILLLVDGRQMGSLGATLKEAQEIIYKCGAINATNLDGGKSSTMYYDGEVVNNPSDSLGERAIPTAIIVK